MVLAIAVLPCERYIVKAILLSYHIQYHQSHGLKLWLSKYSSIIAMELYIFRRMKIGIDHVQDQDTASNPNVII